MARIHEKITNTRKDYLHKISHEIISENQVIVSENLQIKNMARNHHLAKSIADVSWYELTRQLEYKSKWNRRPYIKVDTFFASSQICSVGVVYGFLTYYFWCFRIIESEFIIKIFAPFVPVIVISLIMNGLPLGEIAEAAGSWLIVLASYICVVLDVRKAVNVRNVQDEDI